MSNKLKILKSTAMYTGVSIISQAIALPKSIIIGLVLMPEEFGLYNSIFIWFHYLTIFNIGLCSAAGRESAHYFGQKGKEALGIEIQNKAVSIDFFIVLFITLCFIIYSLQKQNAFLISCYVLVAITYLLNQISSYYERFNSARNLFTGVAKANLLRNTLSPVLIIITVYHLKIYALFVIPVFALLVKILYYRIKMPLNARLTFNYTGVGPLLYCGFFLGLTSMLSTFYFVIDRTFIKIYLDDTIMGLYSFALLFMMTIHALFANFMSISVDTLNKSSSSLELDKVVQQSMVYIKYLLLFTVAIIVIAQFFYYILVSCFLTNYRESGTIFIILSAMLFPYAMSLIPTSLLASHLMKRDKTTALVLFLSIVSGIAFNALFIYLG
ncbi:oligosaccharide flippase family protein, partial [Candidatus Pacearchaeota archaeon]|nr:oligosaccharide flippase family protein [Candidatus Pacearchaeota archaeon]